MIIMILVFGIQCYRLNLTIANIHSYVRGSLKTWSLAAVEMLIVHK